MIVIVTFELFQYPKDVETLQKKKNTKLTPTNANNCYIYIYRLHILFSILTNTNIYVVDRGGYFFLFMVTASIAFRSLDIYKFVFRFRIINSSEKTKIIQSFIFLICFQIYLQSIPFLFLSLSFSFSRHTKINIFLAIINVVSLLLTLRTNTYLLMVGTI